MADLIIGVDEAGRGPLAGPVVAGAVILCDGGIIGLNDSKKLSESKRIRLESEIKSRCRWAIGVASVEEIDTINILQATMLAMTRAVEGVLSLRAERSNPELGHASLDCFVPDAPRNDEIMVLVDGNRLPKWHYSARAIIGGDGTEPAISAASIIAKQARDAMMRDADAAYPGYGFARHKGYGTAAHIDALNRLGPCPIHRRSFAPVAAIACDRGRPEKGNDESYPGESFVSHH